MNLWQIDLAVLSVWNFPWYADHESSVIEKAVDQFDGADLWNI